MLVSLSCLLVITLVSSARSGSRNVPCQGRALLPELPLNYPAHRHIPHRHIAHGPIAHSNDTSGQEPLASPPLESASPVPAPPTLVVWFSAEPLVPPCIPLPVKPPWLLWPVPPGA